MTTKILSNKIHLIIFQGGHFTFTLTTRGLDNMIEREWSIYCKNNQVVPKADTTSVAEDSEEELKTVVEHKGMVEVEGKDKEIPEVLTTACSCLTELNDVTANEAAAILASYAKGNQVVADVYEPKCKTAIRILSSAFCV